MLSFCMIIGACLLIMAMFVIIKRSWRLILHMINHLFDMVDSLFD